MARLARVVVPGVAHHVTQHGNQRQQTFFAEDDYRASLDLRSEWCGRCGVEVWAYCLMPHERTGRPVGEPAFLDRIERLLGRTVRPAQRGPTPKEQN